MKNNEKQRRLLRSSLRPLQVKSGESRGREQQDVSSLCVATFTAYLLLPCRRVAVTATRTTAAVAHGGVHDAETSLRVYQVHLHAPNICVNVDQSMILMEEVAQEEVAC